MNTPFVWIGIPILVGIVLSTLGKGRTFVLITGTLLAACLSLVAWLFPFDSLITLGSWSIQFSDKLTIFGFQFVLAESDRSTLIILYAATTFLLAGSKAARSDRRLVPIGLIIIGILIASLSVDPHHYGVLFLPIAVMFCVLLLLPPGEVINKGLLRFLTFQIIGLVFVLLAGWVLSDGVKLIEDPAALTRAILIFGIGFTFLFAIFPLYTWVIMIAEGSQPYAAVFIFTMVFGAYTLYFLSFLANNLWLLDAVEFLAVVRLSGVIMIASGGAWAAFQRNLGRLLGYAVVIEVGNSLLSIGLQNGELHYAMLIPRILSLSVWGLGLSILREHSGDFKFKTVQGMARQYPWASAAILTAHFSLAGLPLLGGFPVILALLKELVLVSLPLAVWSFLGIIGLLVAGFRSLAVLVMGPKVLPWDNKEDLTQRIFLFVGIVTLFFIGIFPQWIYPWFSSLSPDILFINP